MTRDEVIKMAQRAGFAISDRACDEAVDKYRSLIYRARSDERERCANVCEMYAAHMLAKKGMTDSQLTDRLLEQHGRTGNDLAATIRARISSA